MQEHVGEVSGRQDDHQDVRRRFEVRVVYAGQVDQVLDLAIADASPHVALLGLHLLAPGMGRQLEAVGLKATAGNLQRPVRLAPLGVQIDQQAKDLGPLEAPPRPGQEGGREALGARQVAAPQLALGLLEGQRERERVVGLPDPGVKDAHPGAGVADRRTEGAAGPGPARGREVQPGQLQPLVATVDQVRALVQLGDRLEQGLRRALVAQARAQEAPDAQVQRGPMAIADQGVGGLAHAIVRETVDVLLPQDQPLLDRLAQVVVHLLDAPVGDQGQRDGIGPPAGAGRQLDHPARARAQALQLGHQQVDHVVGQRLAPDLLDVPPPGGGLLVEGQQPFLVQGGQELLDEERVAPGLLVSQPGQRSSPLDRAVNRVGHQLGELRFGQRLDRDLRDRHARLADPSEGDVQRMRRRGLVVPVGPHHEEVAGVRPGEQMLDQRQGAGVGPLQVVQEQHDRVVGARQRADQAGHAADQALLRLRLRQGWNRLLLADQQLQRGHQIHHHLAVGTQGLLQAAAPPGHLRFAAGEQLQHGGAEGLGDRGVGDVALVGVEFSREEQAVPLGHRSVQLVDQRGLAHPGLPGDQDQLPRAPGGGAVERRAQRRQRLLPPIERLGDLQLIAVVARCERKRPDGPGGGVPLEAPLEVQPQPARALVAIFGQLGQQLAHQVGQRSRHRTQDLAGRDRAPGDVTMHPLHRIARVEGQSAGEQLVEDDAQGVKIAAGVDRPVHPAGLLRGEVGEGALDELRPARVRLIAAHQGGVLEIREPDFAGGGVDQDALRFEALVDDAAFVQRGDRPRDPHRQRQERGEREGPADQTFERLAPEVLEHQGGRAMKGLHRQRPDDGGPLEGLSQLVFVAELLDLPGVGGLQHLQQDGAAIPPSHPPIKRGIARPQEGGNRIRSTWFHPHARSFQPSV